MEALTSAQKLVKRLVLAQLEQDIDILSILEEVLKADDVVLVERPVDLDLGHQLLLRPSLRQRRFHDYFSR